MVTLMVVGWMDMRVGGVVRRGVDEWMDRWIDRISVSTLAGIAGSTLLSFLLTVEGMSLANALTEEGDGVCAKCGKAFLEGQLPMVVGAERYHVPCLHCVSCDALLSQVVLIDTELFCPACASDRRKEEAAAAAAASSADLNTCAKCNNKIVGAQIFALDKHWCGQGCFVCAFCSKSLSTSFVVDGENNPYCHQTCFARSQGGDVEEEEEGGGVGVEVEEGSGGGEGEEGGEGGGVRKECYVCEQMIADSKSMRIPQLGNFHMGCYVCQAGGCGEALTASVVAVAPRLGSGSDAYRLFCSDDCANSAS